MFKVTIILALAALAAVASSQEAAEQNAAPEPYAYAYQTDSSSASEQRSPDGKVTGFYTLTDPADGRERRVEYYADETGFHAKVATNELGTKSENSADVEILASPPSEAQLVYQAQAPQVQYKQQVVQQAPAQVRYAVNQQTVAYQQPGVQRSVSYVQQPGYGVQQVGYGVQQPGYSAQYGYYQPGYAASSGAYGYGVQGGNYNYHLPAQYYSNVQGVAGQRVVSAGQVQPVGGAYRYVSGSTGVSGVRTVPAGGAYTYTSGVGPATTRTYTTTTSGQSSNLGSGNLLLLKK